MTLHAHFETATRDCDGLYTSGYIFQMTESETNSEMGDIKFHDRVVAHTVNSYSLMGRGKLTVNRLEDGDVRMTWVEETEEGYREIEVTLCTDPCDTEEPSWRRDHTAEAAGY